MGFSECRSDLAEDLYFPEHPGVQAACDAKQVLHEIQTGSDLGGGAESGDGAFGVLGKKREESSRGIRFGDGVYLGATTGGQNHRLVTAGVTKRGQKSSPPIPSKCYALEQRQRRRAVRQTHHGQAIHGGPPQINQHRTVRGPLGVCGQWLVKPKQSKGPSKKRKQAVRPFRMTARGLVHLATHAP